MHEKNGHGGLMNWKGVIPAEVGRGTYVMRGPRLPLDTREVELVKGILAHALQTRPTVRH
jgi:hypothetical protein